MQDVAFLTVYTEQDTENVVFIWKNISKLFKRETQSLSSVTIIIY